MSKKGQLLVQLQCDKHTRLEVSKIWKVTSTQCQRKMKYLKDRYKEEKNHNCKRTGSDRKTLPFYDKIDSVLGCRDIVTFSHVKESNPSTSSGSLHPQKPNQDKDDNDVDEEESQTISGCVRFEPAGEKLNECLN